MPGNPALAMLSKFHGELTPQTLKALDILFGINTHKSLPAQYVSYLHQVATGNFGISLDFYPKSVSSVIGSAIWWTVGLVGVSTVLAFTLGTGLGIVAAWRRGGRLDSILPPAFVITSALPYFWVGMVFVLVFGISLHWLPYVGGYYVSTDTPSLSPTFLGDVLAHAVLPGLGFMLLQAVQGEDYPLMQALFLLITLAVLLAILLADIATALLDPRTRTAG